MSRKAPKQPALTEEELNEVSSVATPSVGKIVAVSLAATALLGGGAALGTSAATTVPDPAAYSLTEPAYHPAVNLQVEIHNPHGVLSAEDEARIMQDAQRLEVPDVVEQIHYIVFAENHENINGTVENYLRDHRPDLIGADVFTDGTLFVGVGLDPRQSFVFAGEDVADTLWLRSGSHLQTAVEAIQPGVRDNNIPAGLFAGASAAMDVSALEESLYQDALNDRTANILLAGGGAGVLGLAGAAGIGAWRRHRSQKIAQARMEMDIVSSHYGELAQRLDAIDIRAHSLTSPFANATMRKQWESVRDHFVRLHGDVDKLGTLTPSSPDDALLAKAPEISEAARTTRQVGYAEENIDKLFRMEHGDATLRRQEVHALRDDIVAAQTEVKNSSSGLYRELQNVRQRAEELAAAVEAEDFLDNYIVLLADYRTVLTQLRKEKFSDLDMDKATKLEAPAIYEKDYRPGYGYLDFVPYWALATWHSDNQAAQAASSSGSSVNSSFSSGFSGAGGSSSF